ncbi:MAG: sugar phosphate isomerase/epimerase [Candidatus Hydrogenedentes bacterium]|nr:sugar phosphate isomerase/epimerase [Candidatus Hydrogenedentota bacterium]
MKVGMNLLLWTAAANESHVPLLKDIKSWGFDGVELPMFALDGSPWKDLSKALDDIGLGRTVVAVLPGDTNLIGENAAERQAALDFIKGCVDKSVELGAETVAGPIYSPVGRLVGRGPTDQEKDWAVEGLKAAAKHAEGSGVALSVEPLNRFETYFLNAEADAVELIKRIDSKAAGILYDTFHANIEEKGVADAIKTGGNLINHVHISANDRATPGEDHVHWADTFATLKSIGYDGWLTIEAFGAWLPELTGATCIWRKMAPSEEHVARNGLKFIKESWLA